MPVASSISCLATAAPTPCKQLPVAAAAAAALAFATPKSSASFAVTCSGVSSAGHGRHPDHMGQQMNYKSSSSNRGGCCSVGRRELAALAAAVTLLAPAAGALAEASDEEYVEETSNVIKKVRATINMDKTDPNVASAVSELRDASNSWVAKYRREKTLLGRASFRDMYSALNAVSGHYISFGPTAPIPAKRKARILEEVDTAEKALLRGR